MEKIKYGKMEYIVKKFNGVKYRGTVKSVIEHIGDFVETPTLFIDTTKEQYYLWKGMTNSFFNPLWIIGSEAVGYKLVDCITGESYSIDGDMRYLYVINVGLKTTDVSVIKAKHSKAVKAFEKKMKIKKSTNGLRPLGQVEGAEKLEELLSEDELGKFFIKSLLINGAWELSTPFKIQQEIAESYLMEHPDSKIAKAVFYTSYVGDPTLVIDRQIEMARKNKAITKKESDNKDSKRKEA